MRTMASLPDMELYYAVENCRLQQVKAQKDFPGARITMNIQPMSSCAIKASNDKGGNALSLKAQSQQCMWLIG